MQSGANRSLAGVLDVTLERTKFLLQIKVLLLLSKGGWELSAVVSGIPAHFITILKLLSPTAEGAHAFGLTVASRSVHTHGWGPVQDAPGLDTAWLLHCAKSHQSSS